MRGVVPGDRVLVSCIAGCGTCRFCRESRYGQCTQGGGWALGHTVDGVQAEYARVPFGDLSTHVLPQNVSSESAVLLADILPTSYEVGVLNGRVQPGDCVVIVGGGPIGLAAVLTAKLFSPGRIVVVDPAEPRRAAAKQLGADVVVDAQPEEVAEVVASLTRGLGADVVMEAVGLPETFELCTRLVRPGGRIANIGVHGAPATLHLEELWIKDVTITTGLVDTSTTPTLLRLLADHQIDPLPLITHRFALDQMMHAYDVFASPQVTGAMKVILQRGAGRRGRSDGRRADQVGPGDPLARVMVWPVAEVDTRTMLSLVAEVLAADEVGAVPVLAAGSLVGVVSERDVIAHVAVGADLSHLTAGEVMSTEIVTAQQEDSILAAAHMMCEADIRHLPVLAGRQLAGMVSIRDLLEVLAAEGSGSIDAPISTKDSRVVVRPPWAG